MKTRFVPGLLALVASYGAALAAPQTVTLLVPGMNCPVCPLAVKKALEGVAGVQEVKIEYSSKTATVRFDDAAVTVDKLTDATASAGYPSTVRGESR